MKNFFRLFNAEGKPCGDSFFPGDNVVTINRAGDPVYFKVKEAGK